MSMPAERLAQHRDLDQLLQGLAEAPRLPVSGVAMDSRRIAPGDLFLACAGVRSHGIDYAEQVRRAGAVAIAYDASSTSVVPSDIGIPVIGVDSLAERLGLIANRYFDAPSEQVGVTAITGTNGKTTVAWLAAQALTGLGVRTGYAGTLGYGVDELIQDDEMTTPDVIETHRRVAAFRDMGAKQAAIEVSSHALAQRRVDGMRFEFAMFTNLSRDHLDYHGDMRAYGEAKARLFLDHQPRVSVINLDSEFGTALAARCPGEVVTVSTNFDRVANGRPYVFVRSVIARPDHSEIRITSSWGDARLKVGMPGDYNVANAVLVLALLLRQRFALDVACEALAGAAPPPGRMQRVRAAMQEPRVYVDYAHSPAALESALRALKPHTRGKLCCVFGCGGERDQGKRAQMGRIAERHADRIVLTADNPRGESASDIIDDILQGVAERDRIVVVDDRAAAIAHAIQAAGKGDAVLIAGKGHEDYQLVQGERLSFSDYAVAQANLNARDDAGGAG